jgi:hypothetical protein
MRRKLSLYWYLGSSQLLQSEMTMQLSYACVQKGRWMHQQAHDTRMTNTERRKEGTSSALLVADGRPCASHTD